MDLEKFAGQLKKLVKEIQEKTDLLEASAKKGMDGMPDLLQGLGAILPDWLFFIEQTGIGTKERIFQILSDMEAAMQAKDAILLGDALLNGLGLAAKETIGVIEGALHEG